MSSYKEEDVVHYPTLKTILMVENALKDARTQISREELKRKLPSKIMHQTLNLILDYLEERKMISDKREGISWIHNVSPLEKFTPVGEKVIPHYV